MPRFTRGGPHGEDVVLDGEVTLIPVSVASDGDLLIDVARARSPGEIQPIGVSANPEPAQPLRVVHSEWKGLGVVPALSEYSPAPSWSTDESALVFSVRFDASVALGHIVEFLSVVRSTLGDRGYVTFEAREVDY